MAIIEVPKPPKSAWNPNRPVSTLLKSQVEHLFEAERRLPHKYKTQIYINAIKTEGEAADYIQKVTVAIHRAHADAAAMRSSAPERPENDCHCSRGRQATVRQNRKEDRRPAYRRQNKGAVHKIEQRRCKDRAKEIAEVWPTSWPKGAGDAEEICVGKWC